MVSGGERRLGREGFGGGWTDGLLLLADHRPPGPRASVPDGRGHRWLQHPPHAHHAGGHVPLLLHQLPLGLQPPPAAPQARVRGQNELPSGRRAGEGTACRRAGTRAGALPWEKGGREGAAEQRGWGQPWWGGGNEVTSCCVSAMYTGGRIGKKQGWWFSFGTDLAFSSLAWGL